MEERLVVRGIDAGAQDGYAVPPLSLSRSARIPGGILREGPRYITHRAGDNGHFMAARGQQARKLIVPGSTGFIEGGKSLVNNKNVHYFGKTNSLRKERLREEVTSATNDKAGTFRP